MIENEIIREILPVWLLRSGMVHQAHSQEFENGGRAGEILDQCTDKMLAMYRQI